VDGISEEVAVERPVEGDHERFACSGSRRLPCPPSDIGPLPQGADHAELLRERRQY
jgi:hypothetical protein